MVCAGSLFQRNLVIKKEETTWSVAGFTAVPQLMVLLVLLSCACLEVLLILEYHVRKEILNWFFF